MSIRCQDFWNQWQLKLRESLPHLVDFIMRHVVCDASVVFQASFVPKRFKQSWAKKSAVKVLKLKIYFHKRGKEIPISGD